MLVLLADDHALFRDGLASLLGAWGHEVVGMASDGDAAVELADRLRPELVLMDVRMPGGGGIEATARLAALHPEIPIVMLTASEDEDDLFTAIKAGARDQVDSFCVLLERHIRTEERQLFVLAQNRMNPAKMAELGQQIKPRLR